MSRGVTTMPITKEHLDLMGDVLLVDIRVKFDDWMSKSPEARARMLEFQRIFGWTGDGSPAGPENP